MVKAPHEALHHIFRHEAHLVGHAFSRTLGINFPTSSSVSVINCDLTEILPIERRVDTPLMFETDNGPHIVVIESQTATDETRQLSWPYYVSYLNNKFKCPVTLLVVTADTGTAAWARKPMHVGLAEWPTLTLRPLVIGPDNAPRILTTADAENDVMLTVLSALTHRNDMQVGAILGALITALRTVDEETTEFLVDFTDVGLDGSPAADIWRKLMTTMDLPYKSKLRQMWSDEGKAEGRAAEAATSIIDILTARGLPVPEDIASRIRGISDLDTLKTMRINAITVEKAEDVLPG